MKLTVESLDNRNVKIALNWNGKDYSETWAETEDGCSTVGKSGIFEQMEKDGVTVNDTDIGDFLDDIDVLNFISLADREKEWDDCQVEQSSNPPGAAEKQIQGQLNKGEIECIYRHLKMFVFTYLDKKKNVPDACAGCNHYCSSDEHTLDPWSAFYKLANLVEPYSGREGASK